MAEQTKTIKVDVKNNFRKTAEDGKKMNKVVFDTKSAINDVLKSGDAYEKQLKDVNKIVKETPLNVRDMNKQIQAYQSIALSAGRETPVGKEALKKAADLRDRYIDIQNETKRLADDQKNLQGVMQLASTGVAGFGAVQSSMALMGGESEELRKTMTKLMAAQTLLNSINQIATALEKESSAMLLLKSIRTKALTVAQTIYTAVTGKATKATKLFKLALASTGIGLIVIAIGLLIANFDKLLIPMKAAIQGLKNFGDAIGLTNFAEEDMAKKREDRAVTNAERLQKEIDNLKEIKDNLDKNYQAYQKQLNAEIVALEQSKEGLKNKEKIAEIDEQIRQKAIEGIKKEYDTFKEGEQLKLDGYEKEIKRNQARIDAAKARGSSAYKTELFYVQKYTAEANKLRQELNTNNFTEYQEYLNKLGAIDIKQAKKEESNLKDRQSKYKSYLQERLNARRKIEDLENSLLEDGIDKELEISADKNRRLIEDTKKNSKLKGEEKARLVAIYEEKAETEAEAIRNKYRLKDLVEERKHQANKEKQENDYLDKIAKIQEENFEATLSDEELEIRRVEEKYFTLLEMAQGNADDLNEVEINRLNALNEVYIKHDDIRIASEKKSNNDAVALKQTELNAKFALITGSLDAINELVGAFTAKDEKNAKKQFKVQKALSLASAVTNTAQAVTSALATANPIPGGRFIEAGIAGTMGLANIVKIGSTSFESPSPDSGGGGGAQGPIASGGQPANFNIVGENGINQLAELQGQPTKAYVVSDDVTSAQAMDRKISDFATL